MSIGDIFLLVVRWVHAVSAVVWVGGSLFYLLVLRPAAARSPGSASLLAATAAEFRALVNACIVILLATGAILALDRLTGPVVDAPYVVTLGLKVVLSAWMVMQVQAERRRSQLLREFRTHPQPVATGAGKIGRALSGYNALVIVGVTVLFLSDLLRVLFELALANT